MTISNTMKVYGFIKRRMIAAGGRRQEERGTRKVLRVTNMFTVCCW